MITLENLNLQVAEEFNTITFNGVTIEIKKYLPIEQKYDLIMVALQKAKEPNGAYNDLKLQAFFELNIAYLYTNIEFDEDVNESELYDLMMQSGLMDAIIKAVPEYDNLFYSLNEIRTAEERYSTTVAGVLSKFMGELPTNAEKAKDTLDSFDKEKFKELMNFVLALNGGRDVVIRGGAEN